MSKFDYPKLSTTEITSILAESQIMVVSLNDLKNPKPDFVSDLYTRLLMYLDIIHQEDQGQLEFDAMQRLDNPDLHVGSVPTMTLYCRIKTVVSSIGCPVNFTLKDLIKPDAARTEFFFGAIINFCIFKDSKMETLRPIVNDLDQLDGQRQELEAKLSKLNAERADYNEARERELPLVQELDAKVKELRQTIQDLNKHQMSQRFCLKNLKEKTGELDEKISQNEFDLVQSVQQNADLRSRIVQSPDKLQRALEEKKAAREQAKNTERSMMQSFQEKNATLDVYTKAFKKMSKHLAQMQAVHEQVNSAKSTEKDYKALKAKQSDDGVLDKSLEAKLAERQAKAKQLDELKKQLEKERCVKSEEADKELDKVKLEVESKRRDLEERQKKVEGVVAEVTAVDSKTKSVKDSAAAKIQQIVSKAEEFTKQYQEYNNSIGVLLEEPVFSSGGVA